LAIALIVLPIVIASQPAHATVFPVFGAPGDRGEEVRCPNGHLLVGFSGRAGLWIDQLSLMCAAVNPDFTLGSVVVLPPRGGSGGVRAENYCAPNSAITRVAIEMQDFKYIRKLEYACTRPKDGAPASNGLFGNGGKQAEEFVGGTTFVCPAGEYATGMTINYGKHVNGLGLICGRATIAGGGATGAAPYGAIGGKYAQLGGPDGALGQPTSAESGAPHGGRCQQFQHGMICWHPQIAEAFAVWGSIHDRWSQLGRVEFGYPITDEMRTSDGRGRFNHFRGMQFPTRPESSIFWTPQTGARAIYGAIRDAWANQGWERGPLGYPTMEEHQDGKYRRVNFERGYIRWAPDTGIEIGKIQ